MPIDLSLQVDVVENITRDVFQEKYMKAQKPVIIKNFFGKDAPLYKKWTFDYFIDELGDIEVGIFDDESTVRKDDRSYKSADMTMKFGEYLKALQAGPTKKRIFLFNIFKHLPSLKKDFTYPPIADKYPSVQVSSKIFLIPDKIDLIVFIITEIIKRLNCIVTSLT